MNGISLIGRLTQDPVVRTSATKGTTVVTFSLAVERDYTDSQGSRPVDFIDCAVFGKYAESVAKSVVKGRLVAVEGRLQIDSYTAQDGSKRRGAEVVVNSVRYLSKRPSTAA